MIVKQILRTLMQPLKIHQIEKIIINDAKNNATGEMHAKLNTYEKVRMIYLNSKSTYAYSSKFRVRPLDFFNHKVIHSFAL